MLLLEMLLSGKRIPLLMKRFRVRVIKEKKIGKITIIPLRGGLWGGVYQMKRKKIKKKKHNIWAFCGWDLLDVVLPKDIYGQTSL